MAQITFDTKEPKAILLAVANLIDAVNNLEDGERLPAPKQEKPVTSKSAAQAHTESSSTVDDGADDDELRVQQEREQMGNDESGATAQPGADAAKDAQVDPKGVPFNGDFCGKAQKPFYASGKREGQWKKRQGVDDKAYDTWYAEQLALVAPEGTTTGEDDVDTSAAFGNKDAALDDAAAEAPKDAGVFMMWLAEKQAAELLTQDQIGQAYVDAGVVVTDLFPPNPPEAVAASINLVFEELMAVL